MTLKPMPPKSSLFCIAVVLLLLVLLMVFYFVWFLFSNFIFSISRQMNIIIGFFFPDWFRSICKLFLKLTVVNAVLLHVFPWFVFLWWHALFCTYRYFPFCRLKHFYSFLTVYRGACGKMTYQKKTKTRKYCPLSKWDYTCVTIIWVSFVVSFIGNWDLQIVVFH